MINGEQRKLLFCGKRIDNNEWVYGYHLYNSFTQKTYILTNSAGFPSINHYEVYPNTVSQYTQYDEFVFNDETKKSKIFEHNIVEIWAHRLFNGDRAITKYDTYVKIRGVIVFRYGAWKIDLENEFNNKIRQPKGNEKIARDLNCWKGLNNYGMGFFRTEERLARFRELNKRFSHNYWRDILVIGNIFDNPELLMINKEGC